MTAAAQPLAAPLILTMHAPPHPQVPNTTTRHVATRRKSRPHPCRPSPTSDVSADDGRAGMATGRRLTIGGIGARPPTGSRRCLTVGGRRHLGGPAGEHRRGSSRPRLEAHAPGRPGPAPRLFGPRPASGACSNGHEGRAQTRAPAWAIVAERVLLRDDGAGRPCPTAGLHGTLYERANPHSLEFWRSHFGTRVSRRTPPQANGSGAPRHAYESAVWPEGRLGLVLQIVGSGVPWLHVAWTRDAAKRRHAALVVVACSSRATRPRAARRRARGNSSVERGLEPLHAAHHDWSVRDAQCAIRVDSAGVPRRAGRRSPGPRSSWRVRATPKRQVVILLRTRPGRGLRQPEARGSQQKADAAGCGDVDSRPATACQP